ncbi:S9 family peptidase [Lacimicrobium alkaliphilum]|uniref:Acyl-peptide hydrolase n=1 Tax=Lacimicrobium alkaliphilum TaxID=1526571 RepID=A0ABQ1R2D2_9ALTE|nr:S9 family peptidase [Lacimicrobium alkaliphilum]GGD53593.1 acyl-peptide hydrolase [Lacimicrobium alkaliphilum]
MKRISALGASALLCSSTLFATELSETLQSQDVFDLEYAADLNITNDGSEVYFIRHYMDIHSDKKLGNIWKVTQNGELTPVTTGKHQQYGMALSPDNKRLAYISSESGNPQIHMQWLETGATGQMTNLTTAPSRLTWSADGKYLAFQMFVPEKATPPVSLPGKPEGAEWAEPAIYIDDVYYRFDGGGYTKPGYTQIFLLSAQGGTPRQLTFDEFNNNGAMSWSQDGKQLYFSANRHQNFRLEPVNTDIYRYELASGEISAVTDRNGPDNQPSVSPDGRYLAYLGYDDRGTNYENTQVYVRDLSSGKTQSLTADLDRSVDSLHWDGSSRGLYIQYDDQGKTRVAYQPLKGKAKQLTDKLGGQSYGRPYTSSEFDVASDGTVTFTYSAPDRPADVGLHTGGKDIQLTHLNDDALGHKTLAKVEEFWFKSSADGRDIQGWIAYPPGFDKDKKYPMVLEIHGGPVTAYGPHFAAEIQLYAAAGYVVVYINPRGSSSYGEEFAQTIHLNYPSQDYDDLMSAVDTVIDKGFIDERELFVTGGSGGGVLSAWIVGHTDRFKAAVVAKPVINWYSFVLTSDFYPYFYKYWFAAKPWEDLEGYMQRSPISYVGNVTTPTMLLTGEADYRTPISESEQYYQALKLQGVETAMVRIPDAPHGIYKRPSNLMSKVEYILWWFEQYRDERPVKN